MENDAIIQVSPEQLQNFAVQLGPYYVNGFTLLYMYVIDRVNGIRRQIAENQETDIDEEDLENLNEQVLLFVIMHLLQIFTKT